MNSQLLAYSERDFRSGLALKITGIVFWGLVVFGVTLVFFLSRNLQREEIAREERLVDHLALEAQVLVLKEPSMPFTAFAAAVNKLAPSLGLVSGDLRSDITAAASEVSRPGLMIAQRTITLRKGEAAVLDVYYPDPAIVVKEQRKKLLLTLGSLFLALGFVLQWILHRVLTRPFLRMVDTAEAISRGDEQQRFDVNRGDEFGFLATFINKSLDFLAQRTHELADALTRVQQSEAELFHEKERAVVTLHSIGDAVITTDINGQVEYFNPIAERMTGLALTQARGRSIQEVIKIVREGSGETVNNPLVRCLNDMRATVLEQDISLIREDGHVLAISASASPIVGRDGSAIGAIMVFQDVTLTRELARQLAFQAAHDPLTGLYNRREFEIHLQAALENTRQDAVHHALCYLDLDQFKVVNDTCGHTAGDELLRQLADVMKRNVRDTDLLARLGGDELGILLRYCDVERASAIADDIRRIIKEFRFVWVGHTFEIGASIGVVPIDSESKNVSELLSAADIACYMAKDQGRNRVHVYQPNDKELIHRRAQMRWVSRITQALNQDQFCLFAQPIVSVSSNGDVLPHYEVLVRMRDEAGALIPPTAFIPAAERYDLISEVDRWVIRSAFSYMNSNKRCNDGICAINISGQSLDEDFARFVETELERTEIDPRHVCFEITETTAIANFTRASRLIDRLKKRGFRFALDDFGCGVSSLAYLKTLNVDYLKIDGNFTRNMVSHAVDYAIIEAICRIGHVMGLKIVAECVENQETWEAVARLGIDFAQGYHIAKACPIEEWRTAHKKIIRD